LRIERGHTAIGLCLVACSLPCGLFSALWPGPRKQVGPADVRPMVAADYKYGSVKILDMKLE
jgi:hypothetical protein